MPLDAKIILRSLSPRLIAKGLMLMDKATAVVVSVCWLAALITLIVAAFAVHGAVSAKKEAAEAIVAEPVIPEAKTVPIGGRDVQVVLDRLQHQFPDIKFEMGPNQSLVVRSDDGAKFHQWITALGYLDTMAPDDHWMLREFCVGNCPNGIMKAVAVGQKIVFSLPERP